MKHYAWLDSLLPKKKFKDNFTNANQILAETVNRLHHRTDAHLNERESNHTFCRTIKHTNSELLMPSLQYGTVFIVA
jgi:hypothetical protein